MLCENCKVKNATTHIKSSINGITKEYYLCPECAAKAGFNNFNFFKLDDFWNSLLINNEGKKSVKRCKTCNSSFEEIVNFGKMGCEDCYTEFMDEILPTIMKIHGKTRHIGLKPVSNEKVNETDKLKTLEDKLQEAIKNEEYEKAAEIRDEIKAKKGIINE